MTKKKPTSKKSAKKPAKKTAKKTTLNDELVNKWATVLESGRFKQTTGTLCERRDGKKKYCCLGVLCHIIDPSGFKSQKDSRSPDGKRESFEFKTQGMLTTVQGQLGKTLRQRVGLTRSQETRLIEFNDTNKLTFKQIAARLRERDFSKSHGA